jgi:Zinc carboxypeptidase
MLTSRALFLFALVSTLRAQSAVPTPESHFGHPIGIDRQLLDWNKVVSYFEVLAKSSDRIQVRELGKTTEGRPFIVATIASPETLRHTDRYLSIQQRLADPRRVSIADAERLVRDGKTVVLITCSIHATEVASTHTAVEFAYRLLTEDSPKFRAILDNVIFLLVPSLNPDGVDLVANWYRKTLGTPWEGTSPPYLYQKYVGHDNNRDWYIFSQAETRLAIEKIHNLWHPQIVYDVHQQGPYASRIFVPPWLDPIDPNIDPIIAQECNSVGAGMAADLTAAGRPGVAMNAMYDFWTPSRHYQAYHGGLRILSESASAQLATPIDVKPEQIQATALGYNPRERSWNYLEPWMGGTWRLRDIIDDQEIAWESLLYQAAVKREDMLRAFLQIGRRASARTTPSAFVIPAEQFDPGSAAKMLRTLAFGMVEIDRASEPFTAGGREYKTGSYVIRMQQPYSSFAKTLLERQDYPDLRQYPGGPPKRPYDVTAQTLPLLMGVNVRTVDTPVTAQLQHAGNYSFELDHPRKPGAMPGSDIESWRAAAEAWRKGRPVYRDPESGDFFLRTATAKPFPKPRIGLYRSWEPSMDEGWTRWLFDDFRFDYASLTNSGIQRGKLLERFDVIVFPDQSESSILEGYHEEKMPPEFTGGIGANGIAALSEFAKDGGTLVFLNHSTDFAIDQLGVKAKNVLKGVPNRDFYSPGSLLNVRLVRDPLTAGMPEQIAIWSEGSPAWDVTEGIRVIARYPESKVLASGWLLGEKYIAGKAALVEAPYGKGRIILFGMRPQYRAQSYQTFKMFFNSLALAR